MKKRLLCPKLPKEGRAVFLSEQEGHHATHVLRLRDGDAVLAIDGEGHQAPAVLKVRGGPIRLEYMSSEVQTEDPTISLIPIILEMSILKGDAMEWTIEKAVELGVERFVPVISAHTVVQTKSKGDEFFQNRWQKIADQALKQCGRLTRMEVTAPISLSTLLSGSHGKPAQPTFHLWCDEQRENAPFLGQWLTQIPNLSNIRILIGPEGGWSQTERTLLNSIQAVHLGPLILRAETAALYSVSLVSSFFMNRRYSK